MKFLWSSILLTASLTALCSGSDVDDLIDLLNKDGPAIIEAVKNLKVFTLTGQFFNFSVPGPLIEGYLNLSDLTIYGLDNIDTSVPNIFAKNGKNSSFAETAINLPILGNVGVSFKYDMDLGIINQIPLYGNGEININIAELKLKLITQLFCEDCKFLGMFQLPQDAEDLSLNISVKHNKPYITGLFKHPEASNMVTTIMNFVEQFVCMWFDYNAECLDCILSPIIQRVLVKVFDMVWDNNKDRGKINFDCACLKNNTFNERHRIADKLNNIIEDYETLDNNTFAQRLFTQDLLKFYVDVYGKLMELLRAEKDFEKISELYFL